MQVRRIGGTRGTRYEKQTAHLNNRKLEISYMSPILAASQSAAVGSEKHIVIRFKMTRITIRVGILLRTEPSCVVPKQRQPNKQARNHLSRPLCLHGYTRLHPSFQHEHVVRTFAWTVRGGRQRNVHACARARTHTPPQRPAPAASIPYPITFLDHVTIATWEITIANKRWARRCRLDEA